jgi:hypothetical protein
MSKVPEGIPSKSFAVHLVGDDLEALNLIVAESRRLKPEWQDTPQSVLASIVEEFLEQPEAFDQFILVRVNAEQRTLLRQIAELKTLKQAVRSGTLGEGGETAASLERPASQPTAAPKSPDSPSLPKPSSNLGSVSPTAR